MKPNSKTKEISTIGIEYKTIGENKEKRNNDKGGLGRRRFLRGAVASVASLAIGSLLSSCSDLSPTAPAAISLFPTTTSAQDKPTQTPTQPPATSIATAITSPVTPTTSTQAQTTSTGPTGGITPVQTSAPVTPSNPSNPTVQPSSSTTTGQSETTQPGTASASTATARGNKVLLVYFSRAGENYFNGGRINLTVGNTEVVANLIRQLTGCDVYRIEAADPYSDSYNDTVGRNVREQQANARPAIANPLPSIDRYDTILIGSPIWNVRPPMIMSTFVESFDFKGKTVFPFVTFAVSGLGTSVSNYTAALPGATIGPGLAIRGEEIKDPTTNAAVEEWLRSNKLLI